jgi:uncharacterized protein (TIGR00255 family)
MIKAMTAFSRKELKDRDGRRIYLEIKSFNHRFLEISFNLPEGFSYLELWFKKEIEKLISRGRISLSLEISWPVFKRFVLDEELANHYFFLLEDLRKKLSLRDKVSLDTLINLPEVLRKDIYLQDKKLESKIKKVFKDTLKNFLKNRKSLGEAIYRRLKKRVEFIRKVLWKLEERSIQVIKQKAQKIENPEEKSNFLNSRDISEELNLLKFLLSDLENRLEVEHPVGKELDFIVQEMQREINTLSSKSFDPKVIAYSIQIKTEIERIREELQNVE